MGLGEGLAGNRRSKGRNCVQDVLKTKNLKNFKRTKTKQKVANVLTMVLNMPNVHWIY